MPLPRHTAARLLCPRGRKNEKTSLTPHANGVGAYAQLRTSILGAFFAAIGPVRLTRNSDLENRAKVLGHAGAKQVFFLFDCLKLRRAMGLRDVQHRFPFLHPGSWAGVVALIFLPHYPRLFTHRCWLGSFFSCLPHLFFSNTPLFFFKKNVSLFQVNILQDRCRLGFCGWCWRYLSRFHQIPKPH